MGKKLLPQHKLFVDAYLGEARFSATKAARIAGYVHPHSQGPRVLRYEQVAAEIEQQLSELTMSPDEVLMRLTEQARAEWSKYITVDADNKPKVDVEAMKRDGKAHLIQGVRYLRSGDPIIEFPSAQIALIQIGKAHGLFVDRQEHSGPEGGPIGIKQEPEYDLSVLTGEELDELERLTAKLEGKSGASGT